MPMLSWILYGAYGVFILCRPFRMFLFGFELVGRSVNAYSFIECIMKWILPLLPFLWYDLVWSRAPNYYYYYHHIIYTGGHRAYLSGGRGTSYIIFDRHHQHHRHKWSSMYTSACVSICEHFLPLKVQIHYAFTCICSLNHLWFCTQILSLSRFSSIWKQTDVVHYSVWRIFSKIAHQLVETMFAFWHPKTKVNK